MTDHSALSGSQLHPPLGKYPDALELADNQSEAFLIREGTGANDYLTITTTNSSEAMIYGNSTTTPTHTFHGQVILSNGSKIAIATKTGNYTVATSDYVIWCDSSGGAFTITLPAVSGESGLQFLIVDEGNAGTNNITIDGNASETINGVTTFVMTNDYQSVRLLTNGTEWVIV